MATRTVIVCMYLEDRGSSAGSYPKHRGCLPFVHHSFICSFIPLYLLSVTSRVRYYEITRPTAASEGKDRSHFTDGCSLLLGLAMGLAMILLGPFWVCLEQTHLQTLRTRKSLSQHTRAHVTESWQIPIFLPPPHSEGNRWEVVGHLFRGPWGNLTFPTWLERMRLLEAALWHLRGVQGSSNQGPGLPPSLAV